MSIIAETVMRVYTKINRYYLFCSVYLKYELFMCVSVSFQYLCYQRVCHILFCNSLMGRLRKVLQAKLILFSAMSISFLSVITRSKSHVDNAY